MMTNLLNDVRAYVGANVGGFHEKRLLSLDKLRLNELLRRKNPYLFRAKNFTTGQDLVKSLLDAHLSSQEEAIFGNFLEQVAIFVANTVFEGRKSAVDGIDLEFLREGTLYLVSIKSGPNWANSQQVKRLEAAFAAALKRLATSGARQPTQCVNGCCYGRGDTWPNSIYRKVCGQVFWELISGNDELYVQIIEPLGFDAARHNDSFSRRYAQVINTFTQQFLAEYAPVGLIQWEKLLRYNSGRAL